MSTKTYLIFLLSFSSILISCSNPQKEFKEVKKVEDSAEASILKTSDDVTKLAACQDVINSLNAFLSKHEEGEWSNTARVSLAKWLAKRDSVQELINSKHDFDELQKLQVASEQVMQSSTDYAVRLKSCEDMIAALQSYLSNHQASAWTSVVNTSLLSWQSRKTDLERELSTLNSQLYTLLRDRAIAEAQRAHGMSRIEQMVLENRDTKAVGSNILIADVYAIRMRGTLIGSHIFKLKVTVSGGISPESKRVFVDEKAIVEE